jgi:hypothetical protein
VPSLADLVGSGPDAVHDPSPWGADKHRRFLVTRLLPLVLLVAAIAVNLIPTGGTDALAGLTIGKLAAASNFPSPGWQEAESRLLPPVPVPTGSDSYTFERLNPDKSPVAFDPCRPIHFAVHSGPATPAGGAALIDQAITALSAATGLVFVDDGATSEAPSVNRRGFQRSRYGDRWAPVLIAWTDPVESPGLKGDVIALTSSIAFTSGKQHRQSFYSYVSGQILLDTPQLKNDLDTGRAALALTVLEHELGHLVGLGHVKDSGQIMYPEVHPGVNGYQRGDRHGLAMLGHGKCQPEI